MSGILDHWGATVSARQDRPAGGEHLAGGVPLAEMARHVEPAGGDVSQASNRGDARMRRPAVSAFYET